MDPSHKQAAEAIPSATPAASSNQSPCPRSTRGFRGEWSKLTDDQRAKAAAHFVQQRHAVATVGAAALGGAILFNRKGTQAHRIMGRVWTGVAIITSLNSFRIRDSTGKLTWFHGFSAVALSSAAAGVYFARTKQIRRHKALMGVAYASTIFAGLVAWATPGKTLQLPSVWGSGVASIKTKDL